MAATRLKWKPSRKGGRVIDTPSVITSLIAANKRMGQYIQLRHGPHRRDCGQGRLGAGRCGGDQTADGPCVCRYWLALQEARNAEHPKPGEYVHAASRDANAPAGVVKVLVKSKEDVRKLYVALHGQAIQVGQDNVGIEVRNDPVTIESGLGNDPRARD